MLCLEAFVKGYSALGDHMCKVKIVPKLVALQFQVRGLILVDMRTKFD